MTFSVRAIPVWSGGLLVAVLLLGVQQCLLREARREGGRTAVLEDSLRIVARELRTASQARARVDTIFRRDTIRLTAVRRATDSALAGVADTVYLRADTVRILIQDERRACDAALSSCALRVAAADSVANLFARQAALYRDLSRAQRCRIVGVIPCPSRTVVGIAGLALGAAAGAGLSRR